MSDDHIKSAYEIAMEKLAAMDDPTEEEVREYRRREYRPYGEAIATKYLNGRIKKTEIQALINEYTGEPAAIVKQSCLHMLGTAITLDDIDRSKRAIDGARVLFSSLNNAELWSQYNEILTDYYSLQGAARDEIEAALREQFNLEGIGGTTVKPNIKSSSLWKEKDAQFQTRLQDRLDELRQAVFQKRSLK